MVSVPAATSGPRSIPTDFMFLTIWDGDSSSERWSTRSPRPHAASAKAAASVDLPDPGVPDSITVEPTK